jgi:5-methylcytosine-specific restriction endonuclease McrA
MSSRKEFPKSVKVAAIKRATRDSVTYCEGCNLPTKVWHYDHVNPDGLTGEPTIENCELLCLPCHAEKTKQDVGQIAKAKRREAKALGVRKTPKAEPQQKATKPLAKEMPPRRSMFTEIEP